MSHVEKWLADHELSPLTDIFEREQIDLDAARTLTDADIRELGLPLGIRNKLRAALHQLQQEGVRHS